MKIIKGKTKPHGLRIVIYGPSGVGKSTLASKLPDVLFLDYEDGTHGIDVTKADNSDLPRSFATVSGVFNEFKNDHQGFRNIVIDTADKLEEVLDRDYSKNMKNPVESVFTVNDYGRTVSEFTSKFGSLLDCGSDLVDSGVNLIVLAHEQIRKKEVLEGYQTYDHSELKLSKGNTKLLMQWADVVIFVNYKTVFVEADKQSGKRAHAESGKRWCFTAYCNDWEAKHRACIDLPDDCSLDRMTEILPKAIADATDQSKSGLVATKSTTKPAADQPKTSRAPSATTENTPASPSAPVLPDYCNTFLNLCKQFNVTETQMREYAAGKLNDRYGEDFKTLPLADWPEDAVQWLNRGFDKIVPNLKK